MVILYERVMFVSLYRSVWREAGMKVKVQAIMIYMAN